MIGIRIKRLRQIKGYSINELSEKAGVSKSYLSYIERGIQKNPSLYIISRIAQSLDVPVEELLENELDQRQRIMKVDMNILDEEWIKLFQEAIEYGVTKEEFSVYLEFIKFQRIKGGNK